MSTATELSVAAAARPLAVAGRTFRIALLGNPNTGKTTLFNRLCGARAKTSNFPGTTTAARIGRATLAGDRSVLQAEIVDLPGLYRLEPEHARVDASAATCCMGEGLYRKPDAVVVVVDACNLTRNLMLVGELLAFDEPVVVALNMVDLAQRRGLTLDAATLSRALGCPVVPIVARRGENLDRLQRGVVRHADARRRTRPARRVGAGRAARAVGRSARRRPASAASDRRPTR